MNGVSFVITITKREDSEAFLSFLAEKDISAVFSLLCNGTAGQTMLDILGIEKTEKMLTCTMLERKKAKAVMQEMISAFGINLPGTGISLRIPTSSIGGGSSMRYLLENQNIIIGEVGNMEEKISFPYELIIAISERGTSELVMEAAHSAGAKGGTVLHAKAAGTDFSEKFFGVSISSEKELILIVSTHKGKDSIMRAIMEKAGIHSDARTVLFSLPVEDVVGLTSIATETLEAETPEAAE